MKLICDRDPLLRAVRQAGAAVPARAIKPILRNLKLVAADNATTVAGTDLEFGVEAQVQGVAVESSGEALLPAREFTQLLEAVTCERPILECNEAVVKLTTDNGEYKMRTDPVVEYPSPAQERPKDYAELPAEIFTTMIRQTVFATGEDAKRYALGGVRLEFTEPTDDGSYLVTMIGCSGNVLAWQSVGVKWPNGDPPTEIIIPAGACRRMIRLFGGEETLRFSANENFFFAWTDSVSCYSRLIEGRYPKWRDVVLPEQKSVEIACGILTAVVRRASALVKEGHEHASLVFSQVNGAMEFCDGTGDDATHERVPATCEASPVTVRARLKHFREFLSVIDPETIVSLSLCSDSRDGMKKSGNLRLSTEDGVKCFIGGLADPKKE